MKNRSRLICQTCKLHLNFYLVRNVQHEARKKGNIKILYCNQKPQLQFVFSSYCALDDFSICWFNLLIGRREREREKRKKLHFYVVQIEFKLYWYLCALLLCNSIDDEIYCESFFFRVIFPREQISTFPLVVTWSNLFTRSFFWTIKIPT